MNEGIARSLIEVHDVQGLLSYLNQCISTRGVHYKAVQSHMQALCSEDKVASRAFLLQCLTMLLGPAERQQPHNTWRPTWGSGLPYLLLDCVPAITARQQEHAPEQPGTQTGQAHEQVQDLQQQTCQAGQQGHEHQLQQEQDSTTMAGAAQLLRHCCESGNVKAALRVGQAFGLTSELVRQQPGVWQALQACLAGQLAAGKAGLANAVGLLMRFEDLAQDHACVSPVSLVQELVEAGQEGLAERWLPQLGRQEQEAFVESCLATDRLKAASRIVRAYKLRDTFPDVETVYRARAFARLLDRQLWPLAVQFAGSDAALQAQLVTAMAEHDLQQAQELAVQWQLPAAVLSQALDPQARAAAEAARAEQFYGLALPMDAVMMVDDRASIADAHAVLSQATLVGLDVEWRPEGPSRAALLQVATQDRVFLFDLVKLLAGEQQPQGEELLTIALDTCLSSVMRNEGCLKLGLEVAGDLRKLYSSWPLAAFSAVSPVLDLKDLWAAPMAAINPAVAKRRAGVGLSSLCNALLGKPLDKSMQVSDWERRPLSARQVAYAAQDAHVLLALYHKLVEVVPDAPQVVAHKQFSFQAGLTQLLAVPSPASSPALAHEVTPHQPSAQPRASSSSSSSSSPSTGLQQPPAISQPAQWSQPGPGSCSPMENGGQVAQQVASHLAAAGLTDCLVRVPEAARAGPGIATAVAAADAMGMPAAQVAKCVALLAAASATKHKAGAACKPAPQQDSTLGATGDNQGGPAAASEPPAHGPQPGAQPCLVVLRGHQRLDMSKVSGVLGMSRKAIRIATSQECVDVFGCLPGCVPPFGLASANIRVIVDQQLAGSSACCKLDSSRVKGSSLSSSRNSPDANGAHTKAWRIGEQASSSNSNASRLCVNAGCEDAVMLITSQQLLQLTGGAVVDVALAPGGGPSSQAQPLEGPDQPLNGSSASADISNQVHASAPAAAPAPAPELPAPTAKEVSFLLDSMLGRLCRYLRLCGIDSEQVPQPLPRPQLAQLAASSGRMLLTRDIGLAVRRDAPPLTYLLRSDDPPAQLREVAAQWPLAFDAQRIMSRCSFCNAAAFELMSAEEAQPLVPDKVFRVVTEFFRCGNCRKVFWMGPKSYAAMSRVESLLAGPDPPPLLGNGAAPGPRPHRDDN